MVFPIQMVNSLQVLVSYKKQIDGKNGHRFTTLYDQSQSVVYLPKTSQTSIPVKIIINPFPTQNPPISHHFHWKSINIQWSIIPLMVSSSLKRMYIYIYVYTHLPSRNHQRLLGHGLDFRDVAAGTTGVQARKNASVERRHGNFRSSWIWRRQCENQRTWYGIHLDLMGWFNGIYIMESNGKHLRSCQIQWRESKDMVCNVDSMNIMTYQG